MSMSILEIQRCYRIICTAMLWRLKGNLGGCNAPLENAVLDAPDRSMRLAAEVLCHGFSGLGTP